MVARFEAQGLEIESLKARIKVLEDKDRGVAEQSGDDAPIKRRRLDVGEEAAESVSDDTEEMATVLTSMDAATVLASGVADVPTGSGSIPTAGPPAIESPLVVMWFPLLFEVEHLSTIPETESDKVIKSSVEILVPIPRESEGISDDTCDVPFCDNSPPLDVLNDHFEIFSDLNDDCTLSDDDSFEDIDYIEASPPDSKLVSLEEVKDDILHEKLLNINILIAKIESLNDNPTPDSSYLFSVDLLKHLDREDLNQLWALVKESLSIRPPTSDKEMELWVELKRLYEPDDKDQLWTHTQNLMHASVEWKLYDTCGVHHVTSKDKEIFMLVEKDYPLRKGLAIGMISYKLQGRIVRNKIHKAFPLPVMEFPLPEEVPTASEESSHCLKKNNATAVKVALLLK
nr:hypothetical protein [Tanacetum cinerariifolium]